MTRVEAVPLREHFEALQTLRDCHAVEVRGLRDALATERDRRYAEVAVERREALKIKDVADREALQLERETQKYKDEKANNLRTQIESERGLYATQADLKALGEKLDATIKPLAEFVARQQGRTTGADKLWAYLLGAVGLALAVASYLANR